MKRLDIIVEGQSEREFVSQVLAPYLERMGVIRSYDVSPIVVRTNESHRGGISKYQHLRDDIKRSLASSNPQLVVSMMVDYFRLPSNYPLPPDFGGLDSDCRRAMAIEAAIGEDIDDRRFIPYIQVHEFEAFLYASRTGFEYCYGNDSPQFEALCGIIDDYPNPEDINSSPAGAPSKRILAIVPEYDKVIDGNVIIMQNGIDSIMRTCPRFRAWVETIVACLQ